MKSTLQKNMMCYAHVLILIKISIKIANYRKNGQFICSFNSNYLNYGEKTEKWKNTVLRGESHWSLLRMV